MYPTILVTCFVGAYSMTNTMFSVWVVVIFGVIGYLLKTLDVPLAPLVMGLVLGPLLEKSLAQTAALGAGSFGIILEKPIALGILTLAVVLFVAPGVIRLFRTRRQEPGTAAHASALPAPAPDGDPGYAQDSEPTPSPQAAPVAAPLTHEQADFRQNAPPRQSTITAPTGARRDVSDRRN
jgi:hypothetical protein